MKPSARLLAQSLLFALPLGLMASPAHAAPDDAPSVDEGFAKGDAKRKQGKKNKAKNKQGKKARKQGKKKAKGAKKARKHGGGLCVALSCTDAQREKVTAIVQRSHTRMKADRTDMRALHTALGRELAKEKPSSKELERIRKDLERQQVAHSKRTFAALLEIHAVLDPQQREQLAQLVERRGAQRLFKGRGHGPGGRGGPPR